MIEISVDVPEFASPQELEPSPQEPHLPLQSLLLEERIEEMFKGNQELAGKLRALDGAGGKEQRGWQGSQE